MLPGEVTVPNLTLLGLNKTDRECIYDGESLPESKMPKTIQKNDDRVTVADKINWMNTWSEYIQGNIVSNSAARLIQSFLLNTWTTSSSRDNEDWFAQDCSNMKAQATEQFPTDPKIRMEITVSRGSIVDAIRRLQIHLLSSACFVHVVF